MVVAAPLAVLGALGEAEEEAVAKVGVALPVGSAQLVRVGERVGVKEMEAQAVEEGEGEVERVAPPPPHPPSPPLLALA